jgi:hypothetical protein
MSVYSTLCLSVAFGVLVVALPRPCSADTPHVFATVSVPVLDKTGNPTTCGSAPSVDALEQAYGGFDDTAQQAASNPNLFGAVIHGCLGLQLPYEDDGWHYYLFVFEGKHIGGLVHALVADRWSGGAYTTKFVGSTLVGASELSVVLAADLDLSRRQTATVTAEFAETGVQDSSLASLGQALSSFAGSAGASLLAPKGGAAATGGVSGGGGTKTLCVGRAVARLALAHSTIAVTDQAVFPDTTQDTLQTQSAAPKPPTGTLSLANTPLTRFVLKAVAGFRVIPLQGRPRLQVSGSQYAANPLSEAITLLGVAWYPRPYDSSASSITPEERLSLFAGAVVTPTPGVGLGLSSGIVRGFAVDADFVWAWYQTSIGAAQAGSMAPAGNQLMTTRGHTVIFGGSYAFGGGGSGGGSTKGGGTGTGGNSPHGGG